MTSPPTPPGWYPDPKHPRSSLAQHKELIPQRYWDGAVWSEEVRYPAPTARPEKRVPERVFTRPVKILAVLVVAIAIVYVVWIASGGRSGHHAIARALMLDACRSQAAAQAGVEPATMILTRTEDSFFTNDVRFTGSYATGAWECWGDVRDDNELSVQVRLSPAGS